MSNINLTDPFTEEVFDFLDDLRDSGVTNMFGAVPYLIRAFGINRKDASDFLAEWMKTYSTRHPSGLTTLN